MGRRHDRAGGSGLFENPVDVGAARHQLTEAEFSALRRAGGYCRVLGEFATRVEGEDGPALELEDDDCARRARLLVYEVGCDDALRLQSEAVAIEAERAFEVVDGERDDIEMRLHRSAPPCRFDGVYSRDGVRLASRRRSGRSELRGRNRSRD